MKKLCVVAFVFHNARYDGSEYPSYIPFYIYTVLKAYPDYTVRIYTDTALPPEITAQLRLLEGMGEFHVVEGLRVPDLQVGKDPNGDLRKSIRWLFYDEAFEQYEAVYIGDVDILIGRESPGIYEAHLSHCDALGLPYSNIVRHKPVLKKNDIHHLAACWRNGFCIDQILRYLRMDTSRWYRLSGLHFVKTGEYYEKIRPCIPAMVEELNLAAKGKSSYWNMCAIPFNEHVLYRLVEMSGLSLPPMLTEQDFQYRRENPDDFLSVGYRPYHGIHIADFRGAHVPYKSRFRENSIYVAAYRQFCRHSVTDDRLAELLKISGPFIKTTFERMHAEFAAAGFGRDTAE